MWSFHPLGGRAWLAENSLFLSRGRNAFPFAKCARCAARSRTPAIISTAFYRHDPTHAPSLHACHLTTKLKYKSTTLRWRFAAVKKKKKKVFEGKISYISTVFKEMSTEDGHAGSGLSSILSNAVMVIYVFAVLYSRVQILCTTLRTSELIHNFKDLTRCLN